MMPPILLAVPNVSEGRDAGVIAKIGEAFTRQGQVSDRRASEVRLVDVHSDSDHHRSVFTLAGTPGNLVDGLVNGVREAIEHVDVVQHVDGEHVDGEHVDGEHVDGEHVDGEHVDGEHVDSVLAARAHTRARGKHPHVGSVDVVPLVYVDEQEKGAACAAALLVADRIGEELGVPVFLYGDLAGGRTRAELRRGGVRELTERMRDKGEPELRADFGPRRPHERAGVTLVAARPPLVAFNLLLAAPATVAEAREIAGLIREGGEEGLPGVRAIGVALSGGVGQVSMNIERPLDVPLAMVVSAVERHAKVRSAELVGLAPRAAMEGLPEDLPLVGFDPDRQLMENALG